MTIFYDLIEKYFSLGIVFHKMSFERIQWERMKVGNTRICRDWTWIKVFPELCWISPAVHITKPTVNVILETPTKINSQLSQPSLHSGLWQHAFMLDFICCRVLLTSCTIYYSCHSVKWQRLNFWRDSFSLVYFCEKKMLQFSSKSFSI